MSLRRFTQLTRAAIACSGGSLSLRGRPSPKPIDEGDVPSAIQQLPTLTARYSLPPGLTEVILYKESTVVA